MPLVLLPKLLLLLLLLPALLMRGPLMSTAPWLLMLREAVRLLLPGLLLPPCVPGPVVVPVPPPVPVPVPMVVGPALWPLEQLVSRPEPADATESAAASAIGAVAGGVTIDARLSRR